MKSISLKFFAVLLLSSVSILCKGEPKTTIDYWHEFLYATKDKNNKVYYRLRLILKDTKYSGTVDNNIEVLLAKKGTLQHTEPVKPHKVKDGVFDVTICNNQNINDDWLLSISPITGTELDEKYRLNDLNKELGLPTNAIAPVDVEYVGYDPQNLSYATLKITDKYRRMPYTITKNGKTIETINDLTPVASSIMSKEEYEKTQEYKIAWNTFVNEHIDILTDNINKLKKIEQPVAIGGSTINFPNDRIITMPLYKKSNGKYDIFFMWVKKDVTASLSVTYDLGELFGITRLTNVDKATCMLFYNSINTNDRFYQLDDEPSFDDFDYQTTYSSTATRKDIVPSKYCEDGCLDGFTGRIETKRSGLDDFTCHFDLTFRNQYGYSSTITLSFNDRYDHEYSSSVGYGTDIYEYKAQNGSYIFVREYSGYRNDRDRYYINDQHYQSTRPGFCQGNGIYRLLRIDGNGYGGEYGIENTFPNSTYEHTVVKPDGCVLSYYADYHELFYYDNARPWFSWSELSSDVSSISTIMNGGYNSELGCYHIEFWGKYKDNWGFYRQDFIDKDVCRIIMNNDELFAKYCTNSNIINELKDYSLQKEYNKYLSSYTYNLENITTNYKETYTLEDADGCKTNFNVFVPANFFDKTATSVTGIQQENGSFQYNVTAKYIDMGKIKHLKNNSEVGEYLSGSFTITDLNSPIGDLVFKRYDDNSAELPVTDENGTAKEVTLSYGPTGLEQHITPVPSVTFCSGKTDNKGGVVIVKFDPRTTVGVELCDENGKNGIYKSKQGNNDTIIFYNLKPGNYKPIVKGVINYEMNLVTINSTTHIFDFNKPQITNATTIEGKGSATISVNNAIQNKVKWGAISGDDSWLYGGITATKEKKAVWEIKDMLIANKYMVTASQLDGYCTTSTEFYIKAPIVTGTVKVEQVNKETTVKVGFTENNNNSEINNVAKKSIKLYQNGNILPTNVSDNEWLITENGKYTLKLHYKAEDDKSNDDEKWDIETFNIAEDTLTSLSLAYKMDTIVPKCFEQDLKFNLTPIESDDKKHFNSNLNGSKFLTSGDSYSIANSNIKPGDNSFVAFVVQNDRKADPKTDAVGNGTKFSIDYSRLRNDTIKDLFGNFHIDSLFAKVIGDNFLCSYGNTDLIINEIVGGYRKGEGEEIIYEYRIEQGATIIKDTLGTQNEIDNRIENIIQCKDSGRYTVFIRDEGNYCKARNLGTKHIKRPSPITIENVPNHPICEFEANGKIQVTANGGSINDEGYRYYIDDEENKWSRRSDDYGKLLNWPSDVKDSITYETKKNVDPGKTVTFESFYPGKYRIIVLDKNTCVQTQDVILRKYHNPKVVLADTEPVWCYGDKNGQIIIDSVTGSYPITSFQLYRRDENNSYIPNISNTIGNLAAEAIPTNYNNPVDRTWNYPANTNNSMPPFRKIENLYEGHYMIALTDKNGCSTNHTNDKNDWFYVHVDQPDPLKISISHQNNIIREYGEKGGAVTIEVEGGNKGQFNIFLNDTASECIGYANWNVQETFTDIFAPDKTHKLFVVDYKKCTDSVETGYMRQPKGPLKVNGIPHPALCNKAQGSIKIAAEGGWGHYSYTYNLVNDTIIMQSQMDSVQVGGGQYVLTVIDSAGVMAYDTVTVPIPTDTLLANNLSRAAYCGSDGVISVDISGGAAPYTIETNFGVNPFKTMGGITTFTETKPKGTYVVYISDLNECKFTVPVTIVDSSVVVSIKRRYPSMRQYANGRLEAVATRGRAPYTYLWTHCNTGQTSTSAVWDNVPTGTYRLKVNDKAGCQPPVKIIYLATNDDLPLIINGKEGETGPDAQNGWASFSSDTSGFTKMILRHASGEEIDVIDKVDDQLNFKLTGLAPGDYVLECTLPKGEVRYAEFSIAKYIPMALFVTDIDHASQPGASDGSASLQITGGVAPYVVQMVHNDRFYADTSLNGHQLKLPQLSAGIYTMIVIDHYNKRENTSFLIKEPDEPLQLRAEQIDPSCFGSTNGRIELRATGGWNDYEYALIGDDYGRRTIYDNRKAKESYTFVVIDSKGITDTLTVELTQPDPLRAGVKKIDSVSCFDGSDGAVTFEITGGTAPYVVKYNELYGTPGNHVDSLHAGQNTFRFSDANLCKSEDDGLIVDIPQPDELVIANDSVTHTTCSNNNGKIDIEIAGGIAPYTINWLENGLPTERLQGKTSIDSLKQSGLYRLQVVDDKKCETPYREYRINSSSGPKITNVLTLPVRCVGDSTGTAVIDSADVIPATPYSPFRIEWPHGENAMSVSNLPAGWNEVFVIDSNNCKTSKSFNVGAATPIRIQKIGSREPSCYGYTNGQINLDVDGGVGGFRYLWNTGDTLKDITSIGMGSYTIIATDGNNCHDTATFSIGQPDSLHVEIGEENVLMCPDNTYEFTATEGFKTYSWSLNDSVLSTKRNLIASEGGEYYLEATYGKNCKTRDTVTITIGDDLLEADFYMASDAAVDTSLALVELSNMQIDSLHWEFNYSDFVVVDSSDYELYLKPVNLGQHEITLWAYSGGCVSYKTKQVEISQLADTTHNINLGYNPLIKSITVMPNPTKGQFSISVKLREEHNVEVSISSAGQGKPVERRDLSGKSEYYESFDLSNAGDGVYILRVVAGNEQRVAKVLLTK